MSISFYRWICRRMRPRPNFSRQIWDFVTPMSSSYVIACDDGWVVLLDRQAVITKIIAATTASLTDFETNLGTFSKPILFTLITEQRTKAAGHQCRVRKNKEAIEESDSSSADKEWVTNKSETCSKPRSNEPKIHPRLKYIVFLHDEKSKGSANSHGK